MQIQEVFDRRRFVFLDGGMGTQLQQRGLQPGQKPELAALEILAPRKSTTAILGIADHPVTGARAGCATCHLKETCSFRKRGTTCFTQD